MRVMIVNQFYYPNMIGGTEYSIKVLAEGLSKKGVIVSVLTMDGADNCCKSVINGVVIYRGFSTSIYRRRILNKKYTIDKIINGFHSIFNYKMNKYVMNAINDFQPDIIHTNNPVSMSYWIWGYAYKRGIKIIHTLRDYWLLNPSTVYLNKTSLLERLFRLYTKYIINSVHGVVTAPSARTLQVFKDQSFFKCWNSYNIVNGFRIDKKIMQETTVEKLYRNDRVVHFLYVGKLTVNKGVSVLVDVFSKISNHNIDLTLCGDGPLQNKVKLVSNKDNRIKLKGNLNQDMLFNEYRKADVLVVPSLWEEPFGRVVLEAIQYSTIVVGSDKGGIPETIYKTAFGSVYKSDDSRDLICQIELYSDRKNIRNLLRRGARNLNLYSDLYYINSFIRLYSM